METRPGRLSTVVRLSALTAACSLLWECADTPVSGSNPDPYLSHSGYYYISRPYLGEQCQIGATGTITWTTTQSQNTSVSIYLCQDTTPISQIISSTMNDGSHSWSVTNVGSGDDFRIRISSTSDPTKYDFSNKFTIESQYSGTITVTSPSTDTTWVRGTSNTVRWDTTGTIGGRVKIELYDDTTLLSILDANDPNDAYYTWSISSTQPAASTYRIKISSYYDSGIYGFSQYFRISSGYEGTVTVTAPTSSSTWAAGTGYDVRWTTTGNIGPYVTISLYEDTTFIQSLASSAAATSGSQSWTVPNGMATGQAYRVRIESTYDDSLFALSDTFTISGVTRDIYEPDDSRDSARSYNIMGGAQDRSLTSSDEDWVEFTGDSGKTYIINIQGGAAGAIARGYLYQGESTSTVLSGTASTSTRVLTLRYTCDSSVVHYLRVIPYSSSYGDYTLTITVYNPDSAVVFSAPTSSTTWSAGTSYSIEWIPDTALLGDYVYLDLYDDSGEVLSVYASTTGNDGEYTWSIPSTLQSGSDYRIMVRNRNYSDLYGFSPAFTIAGIPADSYEHDDVPTDAKTVPVDGTTQDRTLTYNDEDWASFSVRAGFFYTINTAASFSHYVYLYTGDTASYEDNSSGSSVTLNAPAGQDTTYAVRIRSGSTSYGGDYTLHVHEYDPQTVVSFINPTSSTTWSTDVNYTIQWNPDTTVLGQTLRLYLVNGDLSVGTITTSAINNGSRAYTVPLGLESGQIYQIKMTNYSNTDIYALSDTFTVSGIAPDPYEPDDSSAAAHAIDTGSIKEVHTLPLFDEDWFSFTGNAYTIYVIETFDSLDTRISLYSAGLTSTPETDDNGGQDDNARIGWFCGLDGTYYFSVSSPTAYGSYKVSVTAVDSTQYRYTVDSPLADSSYATADTVTISWTSGIPSGGIVDLYLYNSGGIHSTIQATATDTGAYEWVIPGTIPAGADYYIKITSPTIPEAYGFSGVFTITSQ